MRYAITDRPIIAGGPRRTLSRTTCRSARRHVRLARGRGAADATGGGVTNPLDYFPAFVASVRARLEAGHVEYSAIGASAVRCPSWYGRFGKSYSTSRGGRSSWRYGSRRSKRQRARSTRDLPAVRAARSPRFSDGVEGEGSEGDSRSFTVALREHAAHRLRERLDEPPWSKCLRNRLRIRPRFRRRLYRRRNLRIFALVHEEGLEPPRLAAPEPKSGASANSATRADGAP